MPLMGRLLTAVTTRSIPSNFGGNTQCFERAAGLDDFVAFGPQTSGNQPEQHRIVFVLPGCELGSPEWAVHSILDAARKAIGASCRAWDGGVSAGFAVKQEWNAWSNTSGVKAYGRRLNWM